MNTRAEIQQALARLPAHAVRRLAVAESHDPVHPRQEVRFARHADGRVERISPTGWTASPPGGKVEP